MSDLLSVDSPEVSTPSRPLTGRRLALDVPVQHGVSLPWEEALRTIARYTAAMLESLGAAVLVTEGNSDPESIGERARAIEAHGAEVLICLRAGSHSSTHIRGLRALTPGPYLRRNRKLADSLLNRVGERTGLPSRGVPIWSWFPPDADALTRRLRPVCVLIECGCHTCPADELLMTRRAFQVRCAYGLAEGLLRFLGLAETDALTLHPVMEEPPGPDLDGLEGEAQAEPGLAEPQAAEPLPAEPQAAEPLPAEPQVAEPTPAEPEVAEPEPLALTRPTAMPEPLTNPEAYLLATNPPPGGQRPPNKMSSLNRPPAPKGMVTPPPGRQGAGSRTSGGRHGGWSGMMASPGQWPPRPTAKLPRGPNGEQPEPMIQAPDGTWISPRAYAMLRAQQEAQKETGEQGPRVGPDGRVVWPRTLPPGFK